ncbi:MAG: hypothetical protein KC438_04640 [Thermomicrobiales bacterium]|nr:hypothetical protein [Thermomicrobiales bacterium]MCO5220608.1 hypothetical protein [Thermomicrobiales bacterium]
MHDQPNLRLDRYLADDRLTAEQKALLANARQSLADEGFYAYGMLDDQQRWVVAVDDEQGQADVRLEDDEFVIELRGVSPGLFSEEESEWRRRALERLARRVIPNVARGMLEANESASWSEADEGVAVGMTYRIPIANAGQIGPFVREALPAIDDLVTQVESQLRS